MDKFKIKSETRESYQDAGIKTLKVLIFLTKCEKNLHTNTALFIGLGIASLGVALYMYFSNLTGFFIIPFSMITHLLFFEVVKYLSKNDGTEEVYQELLTIQEELEAILKEKRK